MAAGRLAPFTRAMAAGRLAPFARPPQDPGAHRVQGGLRRLRAARKTRTPMAAGRLAPTTLWSSDLAL